MLRLLILAEIALLLPGLGTTALALVAIALLATGAIAGAIPRMLRALRSLRGLLLALGLVYAAFTPGPPLFAALPGFSRDGAFEGLHRALLLIDLVLAVAVLLHGLAAASLASALAVPLRVFGEPGNTVALRVALCLESVAAASERLDGLRRAGGLVDGLAQWCLRIEADALAPTRVEPTLVRAEPLHVQHWALACLLGLALTALRLLP